MLDDGRVCPTCGLERMEPAAEEAARARFRALKSPERQAFCPWCGRNVHREHLRAVLAVFNLDFLLRPGYVRATSIAVVVFLPGAVLSGSISEGALALGVGLLAVLTGILAGGRLNGFASGREWAILSVIGVCADFVVVIALFFVALAIGEA